jgi:hypothetical protein
LLLPLAFLACQPSPAPGLDIIEQVSQEAQSVFTESVDEPLISDSLKQLICSEIGPAVKNSCPTFVFTVKKIASSNLYFYSDGFPLTMQLDVIVEDTVTPRTYRALLTRNKVDKFKLIFSAAISILE